MQAQWPPAPYVGVWTRTTASAAISSNVSSRAAVRQGDSRAADIHLVHAARLRAPARGDERDELPWEAEPAKSLRDVGAGVGRDRPRRDDGGARLLEARARANRPDCTARLACRTRTAQPHHHHETALWHGRPRPIRRARRAGGARPDGGARGNLPPLPRRVRASVASRHLRLEQVRMPEIDRRWSEWSRCSASATSRAASSTTSHARRCRIPRRLRGSASCRSGTTCCSRSRRTRSLPEQYRKTVIGKNGDVAQRFSSTASSPARGASTAATVVIEPFAALSRSAQREVRDEACAPGTSSPTRARAARGCGPLSSASRPSPRTRGRRRALSWLARVRLRRELERAARARPGRGGDEVRVDHLARRVDDLVLEVRLERVGGAIGVDRIRGRFESERRLDEDGRRLVLEVGACVVHPVDLHVLDRGELRQRGHDLCDGPCGSQDPPSSVAMPFSIMTPEISSDASDVIPSSPRRQSYRPRARRAPPGRPPGSSAPPVPRAAPCRRAGSRRGASSSPARSSSS